MNLLEDAVAAIGSTVLRMREGVRQIAQIQRTHRPSQPDIEESPSFASALLLGYPIEHIEQLSRCLNL